MQVTLITVGTLKEPYLKEAVKEYDKRLSTYAKVDWISLGEEKISDEENPKQIENALRIEGDKILAAIPEGAYTVTLCVEGKQLSSEELATVVGNAKDTTGKICFIIGSSHGLSPHVKAKSMMRLSFSRLTFPHQLMRVILLESIYRSFTILHGKKYHK